MSEVVIVDSGGANLASLQFALERLGARTRITSDAVAVAAAPRVILPGVGSAPHAMQRLKDCGLTAVLPALTCPVLALFGDAASLRALRRRPRAVSRRSCRRGAPPARGARPARSAHGLEPARRASERPAAHGHCRGRLRVFRTHLRCAVGAATLATTEYGAPISAVARRGNFWCTQFHPSAPPVWARAFLRISCDYTDVAYSRDRS